MPAFFTILWRLLSIVYILAVYIKAICKQSCFYIKTQKMSFCKEEGKDKVIFLSEEDASKPSTVEFTKSEDEQPGLITKDGEINWGCPCLGGMAVGPCGIEFREAFSCFHYSEAEPKGSDCFEKFAEMQQCMKDYPTLYDQDKEDQMGEALDEASSDKTVAQETKS